LIAIATSMAGEEEEEDMGLDQKHCEMTQIHCIPVTGVEKLYKLIVSKTTTKAIYYWPLLLIAILNASGLAIEQV
jgi:hypothetical protein